MRNRVLLKVGYKLPKLSKSSCGNSCEAAQLRASDLGDPPGNESNNNICWGATKNVQKKVEITFEVKVRCTRHESFEHDMSFWTFSHIRSHEMSFL